MIFYVKSLCFCESQAASIEGRQKCYYGVINYMAN